MTPVKVDVLQKLLEQLNYDADETQFLVDGFKNGFSIGYEGPQDVKITSPNLKFREVGSPTELWNKVMKEVKEKRYSGPFENIPFQNYIQSQLGLYPKMGARAQG